MKRIIKLKNNIAIPGTPFFIMAGTSGEILKTYANETRLEIRFVFGRGLYAVVDDISINDISETLDNKSYSD